MAAPIENEFWKLRSEHGRKKLFESPELLWQAACEYFEWCDQHPLIEIQAFAHKGIITKTKIPKMRPYTMTGLCLYLHCNEAYFRTFKSQNKKNAEDFNTIIDQIQKTIYDQKFAGAAAGFLNANLISRDLGLADKTTLQVKKIGKDLKDEEYLED